MRKIALAITALSILFIFQGLFSEPAKYEGKIVKKISYEGLENVNEEDLNEIIRTSIGYPLKSIELRDDIRDIFKKGSFENVVVEIQEFEGGIQIKFICKERPQVRSIEFKGADKLIESDLTSAILIKENESLRLDYIEKSLKALKTKYDEEGLFNAHITYKVAPIKNDKNAVKLTFIIDEGEEIKVHKIALLGAKKLFSRELLAVMETSEKWLFKDGEFKEEVYEQDKAKIVAYYKEKGYLDAQIIEDKVDYEWVNPEKKDERGIFISIKMSEGDRYYFDKYTIEIHGEKPDTVFKPEEFFEDFELRKTGELFNYTLFNKDRQMISFQYATRGYIFARVVPNQTITEREVKVRGKLEKRKFVRVDFVVEEGSQAFIDQIIIKGNKKTKDRVIRRELLFKEGELFDARKMQLSREKVYNLGFFKQVNIDVRPGSREGYMNLIVDVEEQPTGTISLGGGYGTTSGFSIFADVGENNLLGNGQRVGLKFEYGPLRSSITLSFSDRWLANYPIGISASVFYYLYTLRDQSMIGTYETAEYKKESFGYSLGMSYRFFYYYSIGSTWTHAFKHYIEPSGNSRDEIMISVNQGFQEKRTLSYYIYHDSRDNYMNPTKGAQLGLTIGFTGGPVLGGEDHYIEYDPELYFYFSPFHIPFLKTHPIVFEVRASGSFLRPPFGNSSVRKKQNPQANPWLEQEDRLFLGGPETMRGWEYYDVKFPESWRYSGLFHRILWGIEMRIPLHPQMLWFALFFDAGSLWSDVDWEQQIDSQVLSVISKDLASSDLRRLQDFGKTNLLSYFKYSYGFGFRIQIPMLPLRFWFGKKLIYDNGFKEIGGITFQFGIGDMRF